MNLPENWQIKEAKSVCSKISVGIVIEPSKYYVHNGAGIRAFRSANVRAGSVNDTKWVRISPEGHALNKKSILRTGDVLVVRSGAPGTACVVPKSFEGSNCIDLIFARPEQDQISSEFLCLFVNSEFGRRQALNLQGGLAQKHLNVAAFQRLKIPVPPLPEQRKIADILTTWDEALTQLDALIEAQERRKKALMQQLLARSSAHSEVAHARHRLGEVCERVTRRNSDTSDNVLTISAQDGLVSQCDYFNRSVAGANLNNYYLLKRGEFAYNRSSAKGYPYGAIKQLDQYSEGVVSTLYLCFRTRSKAPVSPAYLRHYFEAGLLNHGLRTIAKEGARAHGLLNVASNDFFDLDVFLPNLREQENFARILDTADQELDLLSSQRNTFELQRCALMQRLLTGRLRVRP